MTDNKYNEMVKGLADARASYNEAARHVEAKQQALDATKQAEDLRAAESMLLKAEAKRDALESSLKAIVQNDFVLALVEEGKPDKRVHPAILVKEFEIVHLNTDEQVLKRYCLHNLTEALTVDKSKLKKAVKAWGGLWHFTENGDIDIGWLDSEYKATIDRDLSKHETTISAEEAGALADLVERELDDLAETGGAFADVLAVVGGEHGDALAGVVSAVRAAQQDGGDSDATIQES